MWPVMLKKRSLAQLVAAEERNLRASWLSKGNNVWLPLQKMRGSLSGCGMGMASYWAISSEEASRWFMHTTCDVDALDWTNNEPRLILDFFTVWGGWWGSFCCDGSAASECRSLLSFTRRSSNSSFSSSFRRARSRNLGSRNVHLLRNRIITFFSSALYAASSVYLSIKQQFTSNIQSNT